LEPSLKIIADYTSKDGFLASPIGATCAPAPRIEKVLGMRKKSAILA
jgi:hypothetical protein